MVAMERFRWSALLVLFFGTSVAKFAVATLATNDVHLPEEQNTHRRQGIGEGQKDTAAHGKVTYATTNPVAVYHIEHNQSESAARQYVATLNVTGRSVPAWCKQCNETVKNYCRSHRFLNDHCCCEYSHAKEQLPWMPHTCYSELNPPCLVNAGSCGRYREIKECCCDLPLMREYKSKYSSAPMLTGAGIGQLLILAGALHLFAQFVPLLSRS